METIKRDTVWHVKKSYKPQIDSLVTDWIFGANGDSTLHVRDIPSGMLYTGERGHLIDVKVKHTASIGGSPVGHMVFGEDTLQHGIYDMKLSLDGWWLPINGIDTVTPSDTINVGKTIFASVERLNTHIEVSQPSPTKGGFDFPLLCDGVMLALIIMAFPAILYFRLKKVLS